MRPPAPPGAAVLSRSAARVLAGGIAALRCGLGVLAFVAPVVPAAPWIGREEGRSRGARLFARTLGGRDLALGAGLLVALARDEPLAGWVATGALADGGDFVATLLMFPGLPRRSRWLVVATTVGAATAGLACLPSLGEPGDAATRRSADGRP